MKESQSQVTFHKDTGKKKQVFLNACASNSGLDQSQQNYINDIQKKTLNNKSLECYEIAQQNTGSNFKRRTKLIAPPRGSKAARQLNINSNTGRSQQHLNSGALINQQNSGSTCVMQQRTSSGNTSGRLRASEEDPISQMKKKVQMLNNGQPPSAQMAGLSSLIQSNQVKRGNTPNRVSSSGIIEKLSNSGTKKRRNMNDQTHQPIMNSGTNHQSQQILRKNLTIKSSTEKRSKNSRTSLNKDRDYTYAPPAFQGTLQTATAMQTSLNKIQISASGGMNSTKSQAPSVPLLRIPQTVSTSSKQTRNIAQALHNNSCSQSAPPNKQQLLAFRGSQQPSQNAKKGQQAKADSMRTESIGLTEEDMVASISHDRAIQTNNLMLQSACSNSNGSLGPSSVKQMQHANHSSTIDYAHPPQATQKYNFYPRLAGNSFKNNTSSLISNSLADPNPMDQSASSFKSKEDFTAAIDLKQKGGRNIFQLPAAVMSVQSTLQATRSQDNILLAQSQTLNDKSTIGRSPSPGIRGATTKLIPSSLPTMTQESSPSQVTLSPPTSNKPFSNSKYVLSPNQQLAVSPRNQVQNIVTPTRRQINVPKQSSNQTTGSQQKDQSLTAKIIKDSQSIINIKSPQPLGILSSAGLSQSVNRLKSSAKRIVLKQNKEIHVSPKLRKKRAVIRKVNRESTSPPNQSTNSGGIPIIVSRKDNVQLSKKQFIGNTNENMVRKHEGVLNSEEEVIIDNALTSEEKLVIDKRTYQELMNYLGKIDKKNNQSQQNTAPEVTNTNTGEVGITTSGTQSNGNGKQTQQTSITLSSAGTASKFGSVIGNTNTNSTKQIISLDKNRIKLSQASSTKNILKAKVINIAPKQKNTSTLDQQKQLLSSIPSKLNIIKKTNLQNEQISNNKKPNVITLAQKLLQSRKGGQTNQQRQKYLIPQSIPDPSVKKTVSPSPALTPSLMKVLQQNVFVANQSSRNNALKQSHTAELPKNHPQTINTSKIKKKIKQQPEKSQRSIQSSRSKNQPDSACESTQNNYKEQRKSRGNFNTFGEQIPENKEIVKPTQDQQIYNSLESEFEEGQSAVRRERAISSCNEYNDPIDSTNKNNTQNKSGRQTQQQDFHYSGSFGLPPADSKQISINNGPYIAVHNQADLSIKTSSRCDLIQSSQESQLPFPDELVKNNSLGKLLFEHGQNTKQLQKDDILLTSSATSMAQAVERYFENGVMPVGNIQNTEAQGCVANLQKRLHDQQKFQFVSQQQIERQELVQSPDFACSTEEQKQVLSRVLNEREPDNIAAIRLLETINKNLGGTGQQVRIQLYNVQQSSQDEKSPVVSSGILETNTIIENECDNEYNRYLMLTNEASGQQSQSNRSANTGTQVNTFQSERKVIDDGSVSTLQQAAAQAAIQKQKEEEPVLTNFNMLNNVGNEKFSDMQSLLVSRSSYGEQQPGASPANLSSAIRSLRTSQTQMPGESQISHLSLNTQQANLQQIQKTIIMHSGQQSPYSAQPSAPISPKNESYQTMRTASEYNVAPSNTNSQRGGAPCQGSQRGGNNTNRLKQKRFGLDLYGGDQAQKAAESSNDEEEEDFLDMQVMQYVSIKKEDCQDEGGDEPCEPADSEEDEFDFAANLNQQFMDGINQRKADRQEYNQHRKKSM